MCHVRNQNGGGEGHRKNERDEFLVQKNEKLRIGSMDFIQKTGVMTKKAIISRNCTTRDIGKAGNPTD